MRVAIVRSDLGQHLYLDDVENRSQRCFSSEPAGQSRYFHKPTNAELLAALVSAANLTIRGTDVAATVDTTVANGTKLNIKTSAAAVFTQVTVTSGAAVTKATIVANLNAAFAAAGLGLVARISGTLQVTIDTTAKGPTAYVEISAASPSAAALQTVLGLAVAATSGLTVLALKAVVYVGVTAVAGQTGAAGVYAAADGVKATLTGLTGMQASDVGKALTITGAVPPGNNGTFRITDFVSATSVKIANSDGVVDAGVVTWTEYVTLSVNVSAATLNALSTFALMTAAQQTALDTAIADTVAPSLVETGPALLSFAYGKLSKLSSAAFIPGAPQVATELRVGLPVGAAAAIVANDGVTPFVL